MKSHFALPMVAVILFTGTIGAADAESKKPDAAKYSQVVSNAIMYLKTKGQAKDGAYSSFAGIGPTALITTAILRHGRTAEDPQVKKSLEFLEKFVQKDGGVYQPGTLYRNYETCLSIMCFAEANADGRYDEIIRRADGFVKGIQWASEEDADRQDPAYGGGGYGRHKRPDLSNTSFLIDALRAAGNDADNDAVQRALVFVSRCQNLESEHNKTKFSAKVNDGGFYYTPAAGGSSQAGETANGGLRSYGAMTYAGLKSMLYAGVGPEDPRAKAAHEWIQKHYSVEGNPGMGDAGLYYYYHVFAKSLDAFGDDTIKSQGKVRHWKSELLEELASRQQDDGSWVNSNERWLEGDANLATGFALLALSYCR